MLVRVVTAALAVCTLSTAAAAGPDTRYDPTCHSAICDAVEAERHSLASLYGRKAEFASRLDAAVAGGGPELGITPVPLQVRDSRLAGEALEAPAEPAPAPAEAGHPTYSPRPESDDPQLTYKPGPWPKRTYTPRPESDDPQLTYKPGPWPKLTYKPGPWPKRA